MDATSRILLSVLLYVVFGSITVHAKGSLIGTASDKTDYVVIAAIIVGGIAIIIAVSICIYCCRRCKSKQSEMMDGAFMYPEDNEVHAWPNHAGMYGALPEPPRDEMKQPSMQQDFLIPSIQNQPIMPSQAPLSMPTQEQLQNNLLPTTPPPPPPQPQEPIEQQPYHGALQDALAPYLAQAALAAEAANKGKKRKKNKSADMDYEIPLSIYNTPPPPIAADPMPPQPLQNGATPFMPSNPPPPSYQYQPSQSSQQQNVAKNASADAMIRAEPRSTEGFPPGYQSYLPHLAVSSPPPSTQQINTPASTQPPQAVFSLSQHVDQPPQNLPYQSIPQQSFSSNNPDPMQNSSNVPRSGKQLRRMNPYDNRF